MCLSYESRLRSIGICLALSALATASKVHAQQTTVTHTLYVDATAAPGGDGSDWLHAFRDLQDALAIVPSNPGGTTPDQYAIRIAQGVYRPDRGTLNRNTSFVVNSAANLTGGFGGLRSPDPDQRSSQFVTVLSGDLLNNDGQNLSRMEDNSRHVVTLNGVASVTMYGTTYFATQLNSLVISGGNAESEGGGGVLVRSAPSATINECTIRNNRAAFGAGLDLRVAAKSGLWNCIVSDNIATDGSGGAALSDSECAIYGCTFARNRSVNGAGVLDGSRLDLSRSTFSDNFGGTAGAITAIGRASIRGCRIVGNTSSSRAGGVFAGFRAECTINSCLIAHNAAQEGAGVFVDFGAQAQIVNCTLVRNAASTGGAISFQNGVAYSRVWNSIMWANSAGRGASINGATAVDHCVVQGGAATAPDAALGPAISTSDPLFADAVGTSSAQLAWADKDYHLASASGAIDAGAEPLPDVRLSDYEYSIDGTSRLVNNTCAAYARIDLGAYESAAFSCPDLVPTLYVRAAAAPGGNGRSWVSAYRDLQDALDTPGVTNIWIAEGTYRADRGTLDTSACFRVEKPFVSLHGGFAGTESSLAQRNIPAHPTVLSADLLGNDSALPTSTLDNAACILSVILPSGTYLMPISGLTFRGARSATFIDSARPAVFLYGSNYPAGAFAISDCSFLDNHVLPVFPETFQPSISPFSSPLGILGNASLTRCRFVGNGSSLSGGAFCISGDLTATDCEFIGNTAGFGGGAIASTWYAQNASLSRCSFIANAVIGPGSVSGGAVTLNHLNVADACRWTGNVALSTGSRPDNSSSATGGAIACGSSNGTVITNSVFSGNRSVALNASGAAINAAELTLVNCTVADNAAGPALNSPSQSPAVRTYGGAIQNCIFWNSPAFGAGVFSGPAFTTYVGPAFQNCVVQADPPAYSTNTRFLNPRFNNPAGPDGVIGTADDDYSLRPDSPAIDAANATLPVALSVFDVAGHARFFDAPGVANTGLGTPNYLDIGALEFDGRACAADFNASGGLSAQDIFDFLSAWFAQSPVADFNGSGSLSAQDIFDFLSAWFAGC